MESTMRWYGPKDPVKLAALKQAGCTGVVTALHECPTGEVWSKEAILERKGLVEAAGLRWSVAESIPVHEDIKLGKARRDELITAYEESIRNLGACGVDVVAYNFMPVVDWTRTDLQYDWPDGSKALAFDATDLAVFDCFDLQRPTAQAEYGPDMVRA